ncbi:MAG: HEPN domain-containing protein [Oscillatoria sp. PMC 1051.18]|nr:HEPN domain-containing protein [Oscillatoria sp. PMC 1050.18]MEC5029727.1 HEPN domain-containing protein [Oscillatoria sp. PMC 1051.18]
MPSPAALKYYSESSKARILCQTALNPRLRPMTREQIQVYYHSALAAFVAAWDAYINDLVRHFFDVTADPLDLRFHAIHSIARAIAERALERFNTPNWENTRNLLSQYTGYDPISDWVWTSRSMGVAAVQQRLNQILRVRHSFAHGFSIPAYPWTQSPTGKVRLTSQTVKDVDAFFQQLVTATDLGMKQHIERNYLIILSW